MTLVVRLMEAADIDQAVEMARRQVEEVVSEKAACFEEPRARAYFVGAVELAEPMAFVVVDGEKVVGYLTAALRGCAFMSGASVSVDAIFVDKPYRGSRAAFLLMHAVLTWGRSLNVIGFELATSMHNPERDARFFSRFGAHKTGWGMRIV